MAPPITRRDWERLVLPEGYRAEVIDGELVVMAAGVSFDHGRAHDRLVMLFAPRLPEGYESVSGPEWLLEQAGMVAMAPQPDLMVVPRGTQQLNRPPLLAVEILSRSDLELLSDARLSRIEGKRRDYSNNGLTDYLELDLTGSVPIATRYELIEGLLRPVDTATNTERLVADRPFPYQLVPKELVAP